MIPILVLSLWVASGMVASVRLARPGEPWGVWIPFGIFLGPLWFSVGMERRAIQG